MKKNRISQQHDPFTPLQKLIIDKQKIAQRCLQEQEQLTQEWQYLKRHSNRLIVSGLTHLFFPDTKIESSPEADDKPHFWEKITHNLPYYLSTFRESLSIIYYIGKPFFLQWMNKHNRPSSSK